MSHTTISRIIVALLFSMVVAACATLKGPHAGLGPTDGVTDGTLREARERWDNTNMDSLEHGRLKMLANCNRCHVYPEVTAESEEEWHDIMILMGRKSKFTNEETELVERFIVAWRADLLNRGTTNEAE